MAAHVLVVATVTATSEDLLAALRERARRSSVPVRFLLVMPASGPALRTVFCAVQAVAEVCKPPGAFDEVIVSTLPGQTSRWLRSDVPYRIGALTDLPVTHVVAMSMARPTPRGAPMPRRERVPLGLLNVMSYRGTHPRR